LTFRFYCYYPFIPFASFLFLAFGLHRLLVRPSERLSFIIFTLYLPLEHSGVCVVFRLSFSGAHREGYLQRFRHRSLLVFRGFLLKDPLTPVSFETNSSQNFIRPHQTDPSSFKKYLLTLPFITFRSQKLPLKPTQSRLLSLHHQLQHLLNPYPQYYISSWPHHLLCRPEDTVPPPSSPLTSLESSSAILKSWSCSLGQRK
jgi:hypothetical protein